MKRLDSTARRRGVRIHVAAFLLGMALLLGVNLWTGRPYWIVWVVLGWGIGVLAHAWSALAAGTDPARTTWHGRGPSA